jgi:hypothetical protein
LSRCAWFPSPVDPANVVATNAARSTPSSVDGIDFFLDTDGKGDDSA